MSSAEFVVDDGYASRASLAAMRWTRPLVLLLYLYFPLIAVIGIIRLALGGDGWLFFVGGLLLTVLFPVFIYRRSVAMLRRQLPVGSTIRVAFEPAEFTVERSGSRITLSYDQARGARRIGSIVVYRNINGLSYVLPGELVPDADLARLGGPH